MDVQFITLAVELVGIGSGSIKSRSIYHPVERWDRVLWGA